MTRVLMAAIFWLSVLDLVLNAFLFSLVPYWVALHGLELFLTCLIALLAMVVYLITHPPSFLAGMARLSSYRPAFLSRRTRKPST